jgi:RHS repeat-associated protein
MARPASISAAGGGVTLWNSDSYLYDGSGNLWRMGTAWFEYDTLSRVKTGAVFPDPLGGGTQQKQTYAFDNYGNLQSISTQVGTGTSTTRFDQMTRMVNGSEEWLYMYTADDERFWSFKPADGVYSRYDRFTLRGLDGEVLREFANPDYTWTSWQDYVYRDGQLLANYLSSGQRRHFHLDHLGSPRLVTNNAGFQVNYHVYFPFGEEATAFDPSTDRMKFTGHERDLASLSGTNPTADDLDYMHARHYSPLTGRFSSTDRIRGKRATPQSWNRYAYGIGNPVKYVDPDGLEYRAYFLVTGNRSDPTRHSALYIWNGDSGNLADIVFSHGGAAIGVRTLSDYLGIYSQMGERTLAFRLNLSEREVQNLFDALRADYELSGSAIKYTGREYSSVFYNCAQYACDKVSDAAEGIHGILFDGVDAVTNPVIFTNTVIGMLRMSGLLGGVELDLKPPSSASKNVIVYWSYNPPPK